MKKAVLALATAATIGVTALVTPSPAQAWRGGWGGWGAGLAGGLIAGAVIGGIASSAYAYGPGYGYYGGPGYGYYGGYAPAYYGGYAPAYWLRSRILRRIHIELLCSRLLWFWVPARCSPRIRVLWPSVLSRVSTLVIASATFRTTKVAEMSAAFCLVMMIRECPGRVRRHVAVGESRHRIPGASVGLPTEPCLGRGCRPGAAGSDLDPVIAPAAAVGALAMLRDQTLKPHAACGILSERRQAAV